MGKGGFIPCPSLLTFILMRDNSNEYVFQIGLFDTSETTMGNETGS